MQIQTVTDPCPWQLPLGPRLDALVATAVLRDLSLRAIALEQLDYAQAYASGPYVHHDVFADLAALAGCETPDERVRLALHALARTERGIA